MASPHPLENDVFEIDGQEHSVTLYKHQVTWCPRTDRNENISELVTLKIRDILQVKLLPKRSDVNQNKLTPGCCVVGGNEKSSDHIVIYFAQDKQDSGKWRPKSVYFHHPELPVLNQWLKALENCIDGLSSRPRNLLFFVNPFGGKRKALKIFENKVKPILELSNVKWTTIHTQRRNHAADTLLGMAEEKLREYDVIVAVGGDGTMCEVVTGLLMRGVEHPPGMPIENLQLSASPIPVGVIPAGSSNALAVTLHGTGDVTTAAIHLVLGGSVPLDVAAIQNHQGVARFVVGQMSYGHLADTLLYSEDLRWMGPKRYDWAGFSKFMAHRTYRGSIDMKISLDDLKNPPSTCAAGDGCNECLSRAEKPRSTEWRRVEGNFIGISGANISCKCAMSPNGMAPFAHLSDGMLDLILVKKASRLSHLRYLLKIAGDSRASFGLPFVERYRVEEFTFTPVQSCSAGSKQERITDGPLMDGGSALTLDGCSCEPKKLEKSHSVWNCDGELVMQPAVRVTVHSNLVRIMSRYNQQRPKRAF